MDAIKTMGIETHYIAWEDGALYKEICNFYTISVLDQAAIIKICKKSADRY